VIANTSQHFVGSSLRAISRDQGMTTELTDLAAPASLQFGLCCTEDSSMPERCLTGGCPSLAADGSFRRIVQTPGGNLNLLRRGSGPRVQRNIVMDGSPHRRPMSAREAAS